MRLHLNLALQGQTAALAGDHSEALELYREAINLAVSTRAPEVFFRYYTQCVLESLERTGSYAEIIEFCVAADQHHQTIEEPLPIHREDHASILERLGVAQLKAGERQNAHQSLTRAVEIATEKLPVSTELLGWLNRGYQVDARRIDQLQEGHRYFVVRPDNQSPPDLDSATSTNGPTQ